MKMINTGQGACRKHTPMFVSNLPKLHGVSGRKRMYESADDELEEQDQRRNSASGGKPKPLRLPLQIMLDSSLSLEELVIRLQFEKNMQKLFGHTSEIREEGV